MSVFQRAAQSRDADDVGVRARELEQPAVVAADEQRDMCLQRSGCAQRRFVRLDLDAAERDGLTREDALYHLGRLDQSRDALLGGRVRATGHRPLRGRVPGADAEPGPSARHDIERRNVGRELQRIADS